MHNVIPRIYRENKVEHLYIKGYFQNPIYPAVYCHENGGVFISDKNRFVPNDNLGSYRSIIVQNNKINRHVLIAQTFLEIPKLINGRLVVNHKNGIPGDDWVENLEWSTYKGNVEHAYKTGLRSDNKYILVKDLRTNEIKEFYSISECARFFNVTHSRISWCLREDRIGIPHFHFYILIYKGSEWPPGGPELIGYVRESERKETVVYNKRNNSFTIYETQIQTSRGTGISEKRIHDNLRRAHSAGKTCFETNEYIFMRYCDYHKSAFNIPGSKDAKVNKVKYLHHKTLNCKGVSFVKPKPIEVLNLKNGEIMRYESSEIFARKLGVKKNTLQKHLYKNSGIWNKEFKVTYLR